MRRWPLMSCFIGTLSGERRSVWWNKVCNLVVMSTWACWLRVEILTKSGNLMWFDVILFDPICCCSMAAEHFEVLKRDGHVPFKIAILSSTLPLFALFACSSLFLNKRIIIMFNGWYTYCMCGVVVYIHVVSVSSASVFEEGKLWGSAIGCVGVLCCVK